MCQRVQLPPRNDQADRPGRRSRATGEAPRASSAPATQPPTSTVGRHDLKPLLAESFVDAGKDVAVVAFGADFVFSTLDQHVSLEQAIVASNYQRHLWALSRGPSLPMASAMGCSLGSARCRSFFLQLSLCLKIELVGSALRMTRLFLKTIGPPATCSGRRRRRRQPFPVAARMRWPPEGRKGQPAAITRLSNTANRGRRSPFPSRRTRRES